MERILEYKIDETDNGKTIEQFLKQKRASQTLFFVSSINMGTNKVFCSESGV